MRYRSRIEINEAIGMVRYLRDEMLTTLSKGYGHKILSNAQKTTLYRVLGRSDAEIHSLYVQYPLSFYEDSLDMFNPVILDRLKLLGGPNGYVIYRAMAARQEVTS